MADFCKQCSIEILGEDFGDMAGMTTASVNYPDLKGGVSRAK